MIVGIMQPYFFPYIGYFQLIDCVDRFIVYDVIEYSKSGWINRNRLLQDGRDVLFSLPLKRDSDYLNINERELAASFRRDKLLNQVKGAYRRAPQFEPTLALVEQIVNCQESNLFRYLHQSILAICGHLGIATEIVVSSGLPIDPGLKGQDKVLALCAAAGADVYVNAIGGLALYSRETFQAKGIRLHFLKSRPVEYPQFGAPFVPWLSIIDVMMFNSVDTIRERFLRNHEWV